MKLLSIISILLISQPLLLSTQNNNQWFGRITESNVYIYQSPVDQSSERLFIIEPSYFVKLLSNANDTFYKISYLDINGYIKKTDVKIINTRPNIPYLDNIHFRIFTEHSQKMFTAPSLYNSQNICSLPFLSKSATYYGKIVGDCLIEGRTNIWYYCKYVNNSTNYGYIYSDGCDQMTAWTPNYEQFTYLSKVDFNQNNLALSVISTASNKYKYIVLLSSIPIIIFVFMVIGGKSILKHSKKERVKETKPSFDPHI